MRQFVKLKNFPIPNKDERKDSSGILVPKFKLKNI